MKKILLIIYTITFAFILSLNAPEVLPIVQTGHADDIICLNWDSSGRYIASADKSNDVVIMDVISGKQFYKFKIPGKQKIKALSFKGQSELLIATRKNTYTFSMRSLELRTTDKNVSAEIEIKEYKLRGPFVKKGMQSLPNRDMFVHFTSIAISPDANTVVVGDERGWLYFCDANLKLISKEHMHYLHVNDIDFSDNGNFVAIASSDRSISVWSIGENEVSFEKHLIPRSFSVFSMQVDKDGERLAFGDELGYVYMMRFKEDKIEINGIDTHNAKVNDINFSPNPEVIATAGGDNKAAVVDFENNIPLQYFRLHPPATKLKETFNIKGIQNKVDNEDAGEGLWFDENVYSVAISRDGKRIAYSGGKYGDRNPVMEVSNIASLKINEPKEKRKYKRIEAGKSEKEFEHIYYQLCFQDNKTFWGMGEKHNVASRYKFNLAGYEHENDASVTSSLNSTEFDNNYMLTMKRAPKSMQGVYLEKKDPKSGDKYSCSGFDIKRDGRGTNVKYIGHRSYINDVEINIEHGYLISSADDASICLWNIETGELLLTIYVIDQGKLIIITPDNYYMATGDALTGLGFNYNGRVFPPEQFDLKYNRPDIVLQQFGYFPDDIVELYHKAYLKRLSKSGFTEESLDGEIQMPELEIVNISDIDYNTNAESIDLSLTAKDERYNLDRINVWVNDVPIFGTKGMSMEDKDSKEISASVKIPLSIGLNKIQVSCHNSGGVESLKEDFEVYCSQELKDKPNLYLISLAVADYEIDAYNLRYTVNDGIGFVDLFERNKDKYSEVFVDTFFNSSCTRENVLAVKDKLMKTDEEDFVIIHIAGHGLLDDNLNFYFATSDIDFDNPGERGLKYDEIEGLLDGIPARNKLLLMDACHSGEVDKGDFAMEDANEEDDTRGVTLFQTKGGKPKTGLANSFELMRLLFADLSKGTGAVVISAASGGGYAMESEEMENGIFTYSLINAFKRRNADVDENKQITVSELRNYIFEEVKVLSEGKQQPTSRKVNLSNDFILW